MKVVHACRRLTGRLVVLMLTLFIVSGVAVMSIPAKSYAFDVLPPGICNGGTAPSSVCQDRTNTADPVSGTNGVILEVANILATVAGVAAVIVILLAGLNYITSGGDAAKTQTAKNAIVYALIGIVVILLARGIIGLVIGRL